MNLPIRAYLFLRSPEGEWSVDVCRDFQRVLDGWNDRPNERYIGVLHLGFDRPPASAFECVPIGHEGRMFLTAGAKFGLPKGYDSSDSAVATVEGLPIYIATNGWGYSLNTQLISTQETAPPQPLKPLSSDWVAEFLEKHPEESGEFRSFNIYDESSYIAREGGLNWATRLKAGVYRYASFFGDFTHDPTQMARASPPWLQERPFETIELSTRLSKFLMRLGVKKVGELTKYRFEEIIGAHKIGAKSIEELRMAVLSSLHAGPYSLEERIEQASDEPLMVKIEKALSRLNERGNNILRRRMGFGQSPETLEQIANDYGLTRERIRQIESQTVKRLILMEHWDDLLVRRLKALLCDRDIPLAVHGVEAVDNWFVGVSSLSAAIPYILENICGNQVHIVVVEGVEYFTFLDQDTWEQSEREARRILRSAVGQAWSLEHCKAVVSALLNDKAREFRSLLWQRASKNCHFVEQLDGGELLISYGEGVEHTVGDILAASQRPLHYSELAELASIHLGRSIDHRSAHNAALNVGIPMGKGHYGLDKHLGLSLEAQELIRNAASEIITNGPSGRQWHIDEIHSCLLEREDLYGFAISKYKLDHILRYSPAVARIGRMVWVTANDTATSASNRIDLRQAVISLLQLEGGPLAYTEIKQRMSAERGVNETFQISQRDPLIRLDTKLWGLNDRDVPIKRNEQFAFIEIVVGLLHERGVGIHITEVAEMGLCTLYEGLTPQFVFALASLDEKMRVGSGQFLYLNAWGSPRREGITEAVRGILLESTAPLSIDEIADRARLRTSLTFANTRVSSCLQVIEATRDPNTSLWTLNVVDAGDASNDDFEE